MSLGFYFTYFMRYHTPLEMVYSFFRAYCCQPKNKVKTDPDSKETLDDLEKTEFYFKM